MHAGCRTYGDNGGDDECVSLGCVYQAHGNEDARARSQTWVTRYDTATLHSLFQSACT